MKHGHQLLARVPSLSDPKKSYAITLYGGQKWCECDAFYAWKKRGEECWHLRIYATAAKALDRCWTEHETRDGYVCVACLIGLLAKMASAVKQHYMRKEEAQEKIKRARSSRKKNKKRRQN